VLSFEKISRARQAKNRDCASPIQAPQKPSTFIRTHNETLSVAAMRVRNEDRWPATIHRLRHSRNSSWLC
jgi:hypothetical protein